MKLEWTTALSIGHEKIDQQHKELFRVFNVFIERCAQGDAKTTLVKLHDSLQKYIKVHFSDEEALMVQAAYPDYAHHKREHQGFQQRIEGIRKEIEGDGPTLFSLIATNKALIHWLTEHIQEKDQKLGAFLKTR